MTAAKKVNESGKTIVVLTLMFGLFIFALNYMTPMIVDDYTYCFSFKDGKRITSVLQIVPSMIGHYDFMNGKLVVHGIFQILLMLPLEIFDFLNAVMTCLLCYMIYEYIWRINHAVHNAVLYFFVTAALWLFVPAFGHVFLWAAGAMNYVWTTVFLLLYMKPAYTDFPKEYSRGFRIFYVLTGCIMGTLVESTSFAVIGFFIIWALDKIVLKKERVALWKLLPIVTMLCGYLLIVFAPGTLKKKINVHKDYVRSIIGGIQLYWVTFFWLLIIGLLLTAIILLFFQEKKRLLEVAVWVFLSFGMNCMLSIAAYRPGRSMAGSAMFLIIADGILLSVLFDHAVSLISKDSWMNKITWLCRIATGYVCLFMLYLLVFTLPSGVRDIHDTWRQIVEDENYIRAEVEKGEKDIRVPMIKSSTSYSASNELRYVDPEYYALQNKAMAKYFGARRIYGIDESDEQQK